MSKITLGAAVFAAIVSRMAAAASVVAQQQTAPVPWSGCCGVSPWPTMGPGIMGRGMMGQGGQGMMGQGGQGMMGQGGQGMMGGGYGSMPRMHFAMMSGIPAPYNSTDQPAAENPRDGRTRRCGIREKLRFLPRGDRLRRWASGPNALSARRQSRVSFTNADGSVGPVHVLDGRRGRRAVWECDARIQRYVIQRRDLGSRRLYTGPIATDNS